jgi:hypothetical protein
MLFRAKIPDSNSIKGIAKPSVERGANIGASKQADGRMKTVRYWVLVTYRYFYAADLQDVFEFVSGERGWRLAPSKMAFYLLQVNWVFRFFEPDWHWRLSDILQEQKYERGVAHCLSQYR